MSPRSAGSAGTSGIAYQLVDDLLGVFGNESATGKSSMGDLREGKRTVLIAYAAQTPCWAELSAHYRPPGHGPGATPTAPGSILVDCGARAVRPGARRASTPPVPAGHLECAEVPAGLAAVLDDVVVLLREPGPVAVGQVTGLPLYNQVAVQTAAVMIRAYSTSFGLASRLLAPRTRRQIETIYALVRLADEIVDGVAAAAEIPPAEIRRMLDDAGSGNRPAPCAPATA